MFAAAVAPYPQFHASSLPAVQNSIVYKRIVRCRDGKMYVPSDSFGGLSPEKKASQALETLLTFTAAKIVLAQLEGSGRGALAAYNQQQYAVLSSQLQEMSLRDPEAWLADLLKKDKGIALRLMEVRAAYASSDFEWDQLQRLSIKSIKESNLALMRKAATASLQATQGPKDNPAAAATATTTAPTAAGREAGAQAASAALPSAPQQQSQPQPQQTQDRAPDALQASSTGRPHQQDSRADRTTTSSPSSSSAPSADAAAAEQQQAGGQASVSSSPRPQPGVSDADAGAAGHSATAEGAQGGRATQQQAQQPSPQQHDSDDAAAA